MPFDMSREKEVNKLEMSIKVIYLQIQNQNYPLFFAFKIYWVLFTN